ncbi:uncharacterized protein EI90DRAFT_481509 [Cantharellus anzutake]|uniref:uncharacterized protein n=1 Tax=Cantharellus anzutake TaxID=1750568 RepID=UPI001902D073|nr:uncharacterized protein EI90DRAFT_481509 [Cantharellus anzutake]KAF8313910.1 hypothetical protein EI90DRAFT_481509 [Cantharellus anzutake]
MQRNLDVDICKLCYCVRILVRGGGASPVVPLHQCLLLTRYHYLMSSAMMCKDIHDTVTEKNTRAGWLEKGIATTANVVLNGLLTFRGQWEPSSGLAAEVESHLCWTGDSLFAGSNGTPSPYEIPRWLTQPARRVPRGNSGLCFAVKPYYWRPLAYVFHPEQ